MASVPESCKKMVRQEGTEEEEEEEEKEGQIAKAG